MAKRPNHRAVRSARSYTIPEVSELLGVSVGTVRGWVRSGLPAMTAQRPFLILGCELRDFLDARRTKSKAPLQSDELYCFTCKAARKPFGLMVDVHAQSLKTARLEGLCEVCGGTCNRMISNTQFGQYRSIFDVASKDGSRT
jgi:Helix-turn-helix domain